MSVSESFPLDPGEGSPVLISAGILKLQSDIDPFLQIEDELLHPTLTFGSFTTTEWAGNKGESNNVDHIHYPKLGIFGNALGLPNPGLEGMQALRPTITAMGEDGWRTILSLTNLPQEKGLAVLPKLAAKAVELGPTAIEINISCPNGKDENNNLHPPICDNTEVTEELLSAIRAEVGYDVVLGAKDSPHASSLEAGVDESAVLRTMAAVDPYVNYVTGINTIGGQPFTEITVPDGKGGKGGMSGPAVAPIAQRWLMLARQQLSAETAILSVGGIETGNVSAQARLRRTLGATLIGGAQEFYRSGNPSKLAVEWARRIL